MKANENALRQEIQRAEQAARQQEQREREALAQKNRGKKNGPQNLINQLDQERKVD